MKMAPLSKMVLLVGAALLAPQRGWAGTCPFMTGVDPIEKELGDLKLRFVGVTPRITWGVSDTPKIVIKKYSHEPLLEEKDGTLVVTAGECVEPEEPVADTTTAVPAGDDTAAPAPGPAEGGDKDADFAMRRSAPSKMATLMMWGAAFGAAGLSTRSDSTLVKTGLGFGTFALAAATLAQGQKGPCSASMEVEVHTAAAQGGSMSMAEVDAAVAKAMKTGQFTECPPESTYYEFSSSVYKGYKGCVGDAGMVPCAQDGFNGLAGQSELTKPFEYDADSGTCKDMGRGFKDEIFWILWGLPMDTVELNKRTGMNPVVHFPLSRGSYPSHWWNAGHGDEGLDAQAVDKEWLEYLGAFTASELESFETVLTEGTESGMHMLYASMMMYIARTTCNRKIYLLVEAPTYGYNPPASARAANLEAKSFFNHSSCSCFATDTCKEPTISIERVGWFPNQPLPVRLGDDGKEYTAASTDPASPWFERMVWPENPTGDWDRKQQGPADRLVCDGCYTYPTYFPGGEIPTAARPDCAGWAFSLTKMYSATVRTGTLMVKKAHPITEAMKKVASTVHNINNGIYSQWSWQGGIQVKKMLMAKPHTDPTSFVGAYTAIMKEKWEMLTAAFDGCPVVEITNGPQTGAYVWFKFKPDYIGLEDGMVTSWFMDTLGVMTTTYYFGFRGTNPSDFYGPGYSVYDFTRMQLYRDISVYREVARRAEIVCGGGKVEHADGSWMSTEEWKTAKMAAGRRLAETGSHPETAQERARHLQEAVPRLSDNEAKILASQQHEAQQINTAVETNCKELEYPMSCLFEHTGGYQRKDVSLL